MKTITTLLMILILCGMAPLFGCSTSDKNKLKDKFEDWVNETIEDVLEKAERKVGEAVNEVIPGYKDEEDAQAEDGTPFKNQDLVDCSAKFGVGRCWEWAVTKELISVSISGGVLNYNVSDMNSWPGDMNHLLVFAVEIDGEWCAAVTEWGKKGKQYNRYAECFKGVRHNGKSMFKGKLKGFKPGGQDVLFKVVALNVQESTSWQALSLP